PQRERDVGHPRSPPRGASPPWPQSPVAQSPVAQSPPSPPLSPLRAPPHGASGGSAARPPRERLGALPAEVRPPDTGMDRCPGPGYDRDIMRIRTGTIERLRDALLESGRRGSAVLSSAYETLARAGLLTEEEKAALQRVDPVAETMFLMMAADGTLADTERDAVRGAIRGLTGDVLHSGT